VSHQCHPGIILPIKYKEVDDKSMDVKLL
jgi:hypothetical protein